MRTDEWDEALVAPSDSVTMRKAVSVLSPPWLISVKEEVLCQIRGQAVVDCVSGS